MIKKLAKINKGSLKIKDGFLTFILEVKYEDGLSQHIGNFSLDTYSETLNRRVGTAFGCEVIRRLILELDVDDFSEMRGKILWVLGEGEGFSFKVSGIQALRLNKNDSVPPDGVIFDEILKYFEEENNL
jgi:hypothetical protein